MIEEYTKQLANTNASVDKKDNFLFSKEREIFKKLYSEIDELSKKIIIEIFYL